MKILLLTYFCTSLFTWASEIPLKFFTWNGPSLSQNEEPLPSPLFLSNNKQVTPLTIDISNNAAMSERYKISTQKPILLYADKEATSVLAACNSITSKKTIFQPFTFPQKHYSILPINISPAAFPPSSILFYNHTLEAIQVQVNKLGITIEANSVQLIPYRLTEKNTLRFSISQKKPPHKKLSIMTVGGKENQRIFCFFYQTKQGNSRLQLKRNIDDQSIKIPSSSN